VKKSREKTTLMLIKIEIKNFRSIKSKQVFHMVSRSYKRFKNHIYEYSEDLGILKTTGIYGHNASGKSNLFKAIYFVKKLIEDKNYLFNSDSKNIFSPFRFDDESKTELTEIRIDFKFLNEIYTYYVKIDYSKFNIIFEELIIIHPKKDLVLKKTLSENGKVDFEINGYQDPEKTIDNYFVKNPKASFLSCEFITQEKFSKARRWFLEYLKFSFPEKNEFNIVYTLFKTPKYLSLVNKIIDGAKIGIKEIKVVSVENNLSAEKKSIIERHLTNNNFWSEKKSNFGFLTAIKTSEGYELKKLKLIHQSSNNKSYELFFKEESIGTQMLVENLIPAILLSSNEGKTYFIDEIDRSLHGTLMYEDLKTTGSKDLKEIKRSKEDIVISFLDLMRYLGVLGVLMPIILFLGLAVKNYWGLNKYFPIVVIMLCLLWFCIITTSKKVKKKIGNKGVLSSFAILSILYVCLFCINDTMCFIPSISDYYHTFLGNVFVGVLFAIAIFLFSYKGESKKEEKLCSWASFFAVLVALFPTKQKTNVINERTELSLDLFYDCYVPSLENPIFISWIHLISADGINGWPVVFLFETIALWLFGFSWFVKGEVVFRTNSFLLNVEDE